MKVRKVLVNRNLSARSRAMLLYMIDLAGQNFSPPSGALQEFYTSEIEESTLLDIQRPEPNFKVDKNFYEISQIIEKYVLSLNILFF